MQQLVTQAADSTGTIQVESDQPLDSESEPAVDFDFDFNVRDDSFTLFEADGGDLFLKTAEMPSDVHAELVPTPEGVTARIAVGVDTDTLSLCEPADRAESPEVTASANATVPMD